MAATFEVGLEEAWICCKAVTSAMPRPSRLFNIGNAGRKSKIGKTYGRPLLTDEIIEQGNKKC